MAELIQANWIVLVVALVIGVLVAWWVFVAQRRTTVEKEPDGEEATPARRNQALIDAPAAAAGPSSAAATSVAQEPKDIAEPFVPPATPMGLAGIGEAVQAAASHRAEARLDEDVAPPEPAVIRKEPGAEAQPPAPLVTPPRYGQVQGDAEGAGDDLTRIKGLGPKLAAQLRDLGITSFAEIVGWSEADIDRVDAQLGRFSGRIRRDQWQDQARLLARGDTAHYEDRFGKL